MKLISNKKLKKVLKEVSDCAADNAVSDYKSKGGFVYKLGVENRFGNLLCTYFKENDIELYQEMLAIHDKYGNDDLCGGRFIVQKYFKGKENSFNNVLTQEIYSITSLTKIDRDSKGER